MAERCDDSAATLLAELWAVDLAAQDREMRELDEFGDEGAWRGEDMWPVDGPTGSCGGCFGRGCGCGEGM